MAAANVAACGVGTAPASGAGSGSASVAASGAATAEGANGTVWETACDAGGTATSLARENGCACGVFLATTVNVASGRATSNAT